MMHFSKGFSLIRVLVYLLLVISAYVFTPQLYIAYRKHQLQDEQNQGVQQLEPLERRWRDAVTLAGSTSRIALDGPVNIMQSIRRDAQAMEIKGCLSSAKTALVMTMSHTIDGFIAFMGDNEVEAKILFASALDAKHAYDDKVANCALAAVEGKANN
jgi:hypothetical protein